LQFLLPLTSSKNISGMKILLPSKSKAILWKPKIGIQISVSAFVVHLGYATVPYHAKIPNFSTKADCPSISLPWT